MKQVTKLLINDFKIKELGYDFMGYSLQRYDSYTFHHLIISRQYCKKYGLGKGYWYGNGVILCGETSHPYLHLIESIEPELFLFITSEMLDMKVKGFIDKSNLIAIHQILDYFEYLHLEDKNDKGKYLIKEQFINRNKIS